MAGLIAYPLRADIEAESAPLSTEPGGLPPGVLSSLPVFEICKGEPAARPYHRFVIASGSSARSKQEGGVET